MISVPSVSACSYSGISFSFFAPSRLCVRSSVLLELGVPKNSVNEHRDGAGQEQDGANANGEVPKCLALLGEADAQVDHREADAVEGVEDDSGQQGDLAELEQRRAESS